MKKLSTALLASLMLATSLPALAEPYGQRHGDRHSGGWQGRPHDRPQLYGHQGHSSHGHNGGHQGYQGHYGRNAAWGVLGAGLALGAFAIAAEAARPPVVVVPAAPPVNRVWYYCESAGAYHPYVNYCPEGWRPVYP